MQPGAPRSTDHDIDPIFTQRWSPRSFDGSKVDDRELHVLFEAARWAPSSYNRQPWRFVYAHRDSAEWATFLGLLKPFNAAWAAGASVILFVLSDRMIQLPGRESPEVSRSHSFDAGAAWACLALQATRIGLSTHGLAGVDFERAQTELGVPDDFHIEAAIVVGRRAERDLLPEPLRARETPSGRNPVASFAWQGRFGETTG
ncbi:MAG: nitroreductase family protein [Candidatus Sphingomonas phytovorans]|nr:nitroreductase family protein [Sphingomonas sp.]WEK02295.1 MAG: nitroreductase family protein [Sphingomonas sp.]